MISSGRSSIQLSDVLKHISESQIVLKYLGIQKIPCIINSPLREDRNPSFALYSPNGEAINYIDFSTKERGSLFTLLGKLWNCSFDKVLEKIYNEISTADKASSIKVSHSVKSCCSNTIMQCKIREWRDYDIEYWKSFGITLEWLKKANVYPISHKIITKDNKTFIYGADKYAYVFVEFKEGKTSLKIYQPFNTSGFKWASKFDKSIISLWTLLPEKGEKLVICSSLKDSLCLWINTGIPSICPQGEGYPISKTARDNLKSRFNKIYILFDNDDAGINDSKELSKATGFISITLPKINNQKDVSDIYKSLENKSQFKSLITNLLN